MSAFRDRGGVCDYYKYALIRHLIGMTSDDAAAQLRFAFLCLYNAFREEGPRCWNNRNSNPKRIRALDPELAAGFDAIEKNDWSFAKLVEMGLLPASSFMARSQPPGRGPGLEVTRGGVPGIFAAAQCVVCRDTRHGAARRHDRSACDRALRGDHRAARPTRPQRRALMPGTRAFTTGDDGTIRIVER